MDDSTGDRVHDLKPNGSECTVRNINNELTRHRSTGTAEVTSVTNGEDVTGTECGGSRNRSTFEFVRGIIEEQLLVRTVTGAQTEAINRGTGH